MAPAQPDRDPHLVEAPIDAAPASETAPPITNADASEDSLDARSPAPDTTTPDTTTPDATTPDTTTPDTTTPDTTTPDASGDARAADEGRATWEAWRKFHEDREDVYARLLESCNNLSVDVQGPVREPLWKYSISPELHAGLVKVDRKAMAACLASLESATCEQFLPLAEDNAYAELKRWRVDPFRPCAQVVTGNVARGAVVLGSDECADPNDTASIGPGTTICRETCQPKPLASGVGEACSDRPCPAGTSCWGPPTQGAVFTCQPTGEGAACHSQFDFCDPGLFCQRTQTSPDGVCRRLQPGSPCEGSWQCPVTLACVRTAAGAMGTCGAGKAAGAPCTVQGADGYGLLASDCAYSLDCTAYQGDVPRCHGPSRVGEPCGSVAGVPPDRAPIWCIEGATCEPGIKSAGVCVKSHLGAGATCSDDTQCAAAHECRTPDLDHYVCTPVYNQREIGEFCSLPGLERECVFGSYCKQDARTFPTPSHCSPYRQKGEPCSIEDSDFCDLMLDCTGGVCQPACP